MLAHAVDGHNPDAGIGDEHLLRRREVRDGQRALVADPGAYPGRLAPVLLPFCIAQQAPA